MNHGSDTHSGLKPYVCEEDGCQPAYCGRVCSFWRRSDSLLSCPLWRECFGDAGIMENAFDVDVSSSQKQGLTFPKDKRRLVATKSLTPLRYCGGTCSGCTDATFESETKRRLYECTANGCGRQSYCRIQLMNYGNTPSGL
ncbi:hypothetical protein T4D_9734 [Trichinella pseudospiralis]|uniref:Uncharacterized protein n=1 Tax=Trichinella pseudospiralis TaxID=6337 RepID=A0A0V1F3I2_TRIPS|nr:hypothetical protein T4D_9734 [Trichinella pseudospiralis]